MFASCVVVFSSFFHFVFSNRFFFRVVRYRAVLRCIHQCIAKTHSKSSANKDKHNMDGRDKERQSGIKFAQKEFCVFFFFRENGEKPWWKNKGSRKRILNPTEKHKHRTASSRLDYFLLFFLFFTYSLQNRSERCTNLKLSRSINDILVDGVLFCLYRISF